MASQKKYAREMPPAPPRHSWEDEPGVSEGLGAWNEASSDASDVSSDEPVAPQPGSELREYLATEHRNGHMTAKQVSIVAYWAGLAGVREVADLGLPPWNVGTGDFKRLLDRKLVSTVPETYAISLPAYVRRSGEQRTMWKLPVLLPHELLAGELRNRDVSQLLEHWEAPPNYSGHKLVQAAKSDGGPFVPLSVFVDGVAYAKRGSLLAVNVHNLLTGTRFVICVLRKRILCKCSCKGWETLHAVMAWLGWCCEVLSEGRHPMCRHDGLPWSEAEDADRAQKAGTSLGFKAVVLQLRADWAEIAHTLQVPQWSSVFNPCFLCTTTSEDLYSKIADCGPSHDAWPPKLAEHFEQACAACEVCVDQLSDADWQCLKGLLRHDMRKDGARGLALDQSYAPLSLKRGDRLEPRPECRDLEDDFMGARKPEKALFWRRSAETLALRRNPLWDKAALGLDLQSAVAIDVMHTLCLGVHAQFVLHGLWLLVDKMTPPATTAGSHASRPSGQHGDTQEGLLALVVGHEEEPP